MTLKQKKVKYVKRYYLRPLYDFHIFAVFSRAKKITFFNLNGHYTHLWIYTYIITLILTLLYFYVSLFVKCFHWDIFFSFFFTSKMNKKNVNGFWLAFIQLLENVFLILMRLILNWNFVRAIPENR